MLATIGYEKSTVDNFFKTLKEARIDVLVDIRERAQSRRPGFSKTALSQAASDAGIGYVHYRSLGDPKEGRDAARAGLYSKFRKIFSGVMETDAAKMALLEIEQLARSKRICLLCYERDHHTCHRKIVSDKLEQTLGCKTVHLGVNKYDGRRSEKGRVFHTREGATA